MASADDLNLGNLDDDSKEPPQSRIKDASEGRKCFHVMRTQDSARGLMRTRHQALLDGEPPYDQALLASKGQGGRTNVNWGDARAVMDGAEAGIIDMNVSVERLVRIPLLKQAVPDDEQRFNLENILAEEISRTIRGWEEYDRAYLNLGRVCFWHGVGIAYFEDDTDWRFETTGLGDFVIPNGTKASENRIPVAGCVRYMELHELYGYIRDEEVAASMGWNVPAVKEAILNAMPEHRGNGWSQNAWMKVQEELRSNDIGTGIAGRTAKVGIIHLWVQEFDGTVSKYLTTETPPRDSKGEEKEPWLFSRPNVYSEMRRGMVFFTYSIGEHGTYHSISGLGRRIFPQGNALNRAMCTMLDAAILGAGIMIQPDSEASIPKMTLVPLGGGLTLGPAKDHGEIILRPMPNLSQGIQPIIQDMRDTMGKRAGQFQGSGSPFNTPVEKTRFEVAAQLEALGKVGATQINLWYSPWTRLLREVVRRMCRPGYTDAQPGGREVKDLHNRLMQRGFPVELLAAVDFDAVKAERAIGAGSGASRIGRLTQLKEYAGELDEVGRYNLIRDLIAATMEGDYDSASRYKPAMPNNRPPMDAQIANMENQLMALGQEPKMEVNQLHMAHLDSHGPFLLGMIESIERGEAEMDDLVEPMVICHAHFSDTLEQVQDSELMQEKVAEYRQLAQQTGEIVQNAMRQKIARQQKEMEEGGQEDGQASAENQLLQDKIIMSRLKIQEIQEKAQAKRAQDAQKLAHSAQKFQQDMAFADAKHAANLLVQTRQQLRDVALKQAKEEDAIAIAKMKRGNARKPESKPKSKDKKK